MKFMRKIIAVLLFVAVMCAMTLETFGAGVVHFDRLIPELADRINEAEIAALNEWLTAYPSDSCVIDIFVPGYSTQHLRNSEKSETVDFEITPLGKPHASVTVADIPEKFHGVYTKLISGIRNDDRCSVDISNIARRGNSVILDCKAVAELCYTDTMGLYTSDYQTALYAVVTDKKTGEIVRYDYLHALLPDGWEDPHYSPSLSAYLDFESDRMEIAVDTEKYDYGICLLVYSDNDYAKVGYCYGNTEVYLCAMIEIPVPHGDSVFGDANDSGTLSLVDASVVLKYIAGWDNISLNRTVCDVDANGKVDLTDVSMILKVIAGWRV